MKHVATLDGVRGLAILLVLWHHCFVIKPANDVERAIARVCELGAHGVDLFFVLSGYLITSILLETKNQSSRYRNFYVRRALRIFPLYYALVAFCFVALPLMMRLVPAAVPKLSRFQGANDDWLYYVLFCSNFAVAKAGEWRHGVLDVTWSLAIEEQFYLLWPFLVFHVRAVRLRAILWGLFIAALAFRLVCLGVWGEQEGWIRAYVLMPCRMDALAIGSLVALAAARAAANPTESRDEAITRTGLGLGLGLGVMLFVGLAVSDVISYSNAWLYTVGYSAIAGFSAGLIILALNARPGSALARLLSGKFLTTFGKYSFGLYLIHLPLRAAIRDLAFGDRHFRALPGSPYLGQACFYVLSAGVSLAVAAIIWHVYESRFLALKSRFSGKERTT